MVQRRQLSDIIFQEEKVYFQANEKIHFKNIYQGVSKLKKKMNNYWKINIRKFKYVPKILREYAKANKTTTATAKTQKGK